MSNLLNIHIGWTISFDKFLNEVSMILNLHKFKLFFLALKKAEDYSENLILN